MDKDTLIEVNQVSKKFCKDLKYTLKYGFIDVGRNILGLRVNSDKLRKHEFWALRDVSFKLKKGGVLGIIGPNGSGKSTLLKLLNGVFIPDKGEIKIKGRVGALIEIGIGFHPTLTGRENIYINGAILGMGRREINEKFKNIVEFAGISDFLDTQVKNYSSGMYVRLGFSIAVYSTPDVLLVDEILAVGDLEFKRKSQRKITELLKNGTAVVFVSHNMEEISSFTQKVIYLKNGYIKMIGKTPKVIGKYIADEEREP